MGLRNLVGAPTGTECAQSSPGKVTDVVLKESENPPVLSPEVASVRDLRGRWWVAHTKSRFEKAFAWDLLRLGIAYFLPMFQSVTTNGEGKRGAMMPLFPGYVFLCGDGNDRYMAMTTNRLCQTIAVPDQKRLVTELANIEIALKAKGRLDPYPFAAVGRRCRVRSGPFCGVEGIVVKRNRVARVVLEITVLGRGAVVEVDTELLDAVG